MIEVRKPPKGQMMTSNKVILTYKRKRLSSKSVQVDCIEGATLHSKSPMEIQTNFLKKNIESATCKEKLDVDNENVAEERRNSSPCLEQNDSTMPVKKKFLEYERKRKHRINGILCNESNKVSPHNVPQNDFDGGQSSKESFRAVGSAFNRNSDHTSDCASPDKRKYLEGSSASCPLHLNITESPSPACFERSSKVECIPCFSDNQTSASKTSKDCMELKSHVLQPDTRLKEKTNIPFITFYRRSKKKKDTEKVGAKSFTATQEINDSESVSSQQASSLNCIDVALPENCNFVDQSTKAQALQQKLHTSGKDPIVVGEGSTHISTAEFLLQRLVGRTEDPAFDFVDKRPNDTPQALKLSESEHEVLPLKHPLLLSAIVVTQNSNNTLKQPETGPSLGNEPGVATLNHEKNDEQSVAADAEASGRGDGVHWLKPVDKSTQGPEKDKVACPLGGAITYCQEPSNTQSSNLKSSDFMQNLHEKEATESANQTPQFQEQIFMANNSRTTSGSRHWIRAETPFHFTNFHGLSPPESSGHVLRDLLSIPSISGFSRKENCNFDSRLSWQASSMGAPPRRVGGQVYDNILTDARMLDRGQRFSWECKRYPGTWTEEELDSLWIGVRRHGRNNWNVMLRDPRLFFSEWRTPEDLCQRWDMEQSKLFRGAAVRSPDSIYDRSLAHYPLVGSCNRSFDAPHLTTETNLSLGGVYHPKVDTYLNRNLLKFTDLVETHQLADGTLATSSFIRNGQSKNSFWKKANNRYHRSMRSQEAYTMEQNTCGGMSHSVRQPAACSTTSDLPHWLKDVVITPPPRQIETALPGAISAFKPTFPLFLNDQYATSSFPDFGESSVPPRDSKRGILRRSMANLKHSDAAEPVDETHLEKNADLLSRVGMLQCKVSDEENVIDLNKSSPDPVRRNDVVIIDSDVSSEETISDDDRT